MGLFFSPRFIEPSAVQNETDVHRFDPEILEHKLPTFLFGIWLCGALFRTILKDEKISYTALLFIGICLGLLGDSIHSVTDFTSNLRKICPVLLIRVFTPVLIFNVAYEMGPHMFWKSCCQVALLSVPGFLLSCALTAVLAVKVFNYSWNWQFGFLFGAIMSSTDPIMSVAAQKNTGISKHLILLVAAEGVFNDATSVIVVELIKMMSSNATNWAEWCRMSGIVSVTVLGLFIDTKTYSPGIEAFLVRLLAVVILSPLLSHVGYGFNWRWGAFIVWSGMRGIFTLIIALAAFQEEHIATDAKNKMFLHVAAVVLITMCINSTTVKKLANILGLNEISASKRMAMYSAVQHIRESQFNTLAILKMDRFLADANWPMVENAAIIEDPYETTENNVKSEELFPQYGFTLCPDCQKEVPNLPSPQEIEDMMEEARLRILKAQKTSYWRQYNNGMLSRKATRILVNTSEICMVKVGKFMDIKDVGQYWEAKDIFVVLKQQLQCWMYNIKEQHVEPSEVKILKMIHRLVHSEDFEFATYILTLMNTFPLILDFIPPLYRLYEEELQLLNYSFLVLYILEALLKVLALRKAYILQHWNKLDIFIVLTGITEVILAHIAPSYNTAVLLIKIMRIFRYFRLLRALRHSKIVISKLVYILNKQINKRLSFGYEITKGFVIGEEFVKNLIDQISDQKIISQKLQTIIEIHKQDAMKELGLLERDYPELATSVNTRQAIWTVQKNALETLKILTSGGFIDHREGAKLEKIMQLKIRELTSFSTTILPPTAEDILCNVPWLEKAEDHINYIKSIADHVTFDYGDTICVEGQMPNGIRLILSGLVKLHGSNPVFGHRKDSKMGGGNIPFSDYRGSGAILGDINCLTQQPMEVTITCETLVKVWFISINALNEAFLEFPSLEHKLWLSVGIRIAANTLKKNIAYQSWTYNKICSWIAKAYVEDLDINQKFDIDGNIEDLVLIYGSVEDCQRQVVYYAPCIIPKLSHQENIVVPISEWHQVTTLPYHESVSLADKRVKKSSVETKGQKQQQSRPKVSKHRRFFK
uniref:Sodium/hydrogen exchanger 10-like isoform X3 n=1 Tax=Geotrypetes seraphini TaxID=260995 RepID=A0A6P8Q1U1_GEOSA|nr:sodium/hydrogen exchanger 10-like isoform X3 [Geotrypetes seraphini]